MTHSFVSCDWCGEIAKESKPLRIADKMHDLCTKCHEIFFEKTANCGTEIKENAVLGIGQQFLGWSWPNGGYVPSITAVGVPTTIYTPTGAPIQTFTVSGTNGNLLTTQPTVFYSNASGNPVQP